jgi:PASTA domain
MASRLDKRGIWIAAAVIAAAVLFGVLLPAGAFAATDFYVAPGGSGNACTLADPCNIVFALGSAASGDTVFAAGNQGTYGLPGNPTAAPIEVPAGVTLEGEPGQPMPALYTEATGTASVKVGGGGRLIDFAVHEKKPGQLPIYGEGGTTLERVLSLGAGGDGCIVGPGSTVTDSVCVGVVGILEGFGGSGQTFTLNLRNDTFYGTSEQGAVFSANNVTLLPEAVNTIFLGAAGGVRVYEVGGGTVEVAATHSSYSGVVEEGGATITPEGTAGNQSAAPLLADPAGGDFHELAGSATIDAALPSPANGEFDLDGNARSLPSVLTCSGAGPAAPDIGAYEYVPPTPSCGAPPATEASTATSTPTPTCRVPKLRRRRLKAVRRTLRRADCKLGKVRLRKGISRKAGRVVKQRPRPGAVRAAGTRVNVTLGRGRSRHPKP